MNSSCKCCGQVASLKCSKCADFHTCSAKSCIESKAWIGHALICGKRERDENLENFLDMVNPRFIDQIERAWNELKLDNWTEKQRILWKIARSDTEKTWVNAHKDEQELFILVNVNDLSVGQVGKRRILLETRQEIDKYYGKDSYLRFAEFLVSDGWFIEAQQASHYE